jgi:ABC-type bacteriocin/lantibiotic exporter with double-glycine peptidase domain
MSKQFMMLGFPRLRQVDGFDCGVASSKSVLKYYGKDAEYQEIMALAGTNESGTSVKGIIETLTVYGLDCKEKKKDAHTRNQEMD